MLIGQFETNQNMSKIELLPIEQDLYIQPRMCIVQCALLACLTAEHLAHRIQQPNPKPRIFIFHELISQSNTFAKNKK